MKKIFSFLLLIFLYIISILLTKTATKYIKDLDPVMNEIKKNSYLYKIDPVDATIDDIFITPGISGSEVNINDSYKIMKKYGEFNPKLLIYDEIKPNISISNIYDKYIFQGNPKYANVSFIFKINDTNYLEEIVNILKEKNVIATFFIDKDILIKNTSLIKYLKDNNQNIEVFNNYTLEDINQAKYLIKNYTNKNILYCYSDDINNDILNICAKNKLHTIIPSINTDKNPYFELKNNLSNGSIIKFNNNSRTVLEIKYIINYIRQNNYKIVSLEKLLTE